ncbi:MAG TPA: type IV pilus modification protein PilV [Gammaproteobacteria bacterium]|nr:type IV pilus modification protein PilV [Gammaproteobacteria bacterium]
MRVGSNQRHSGFSLIEAMVSLVVLSVGMIGIASLYGQGLGASRTALSRTVAVNLTADMADRIRVNRLAGAAYGGAAANNNCDPLGGGGVDCTPAGMAAHDLFRWDQQVRNQLPNGQWAVQFAAGTPPTYTIRVSWEETGLGVVTHQITVQVPNI